MCHRGQGWNEASRISTNITEAVVHLLEEDHECTGCVPSDATTSAICNSECLTPCERTALARVRDLDEAFIFYSEPWTCRAASFGYLHRDFTNKPAEVYFSALLVAMLQMVGSVSTILPSNVAEYVFFAAVILSGTVLISAVQGVICGVVTNGDPDEIRWRQVTARTPYGRPHSLCLSMTPTLSCTDEGPAGHNLSMTPTLSSNPLLY